MLLKLLNLRVLHHAHALFVKPLLGAHIVSEAVVVNSIKSKLLEALARIVYKPTKRVSSIKLMKLAKRKVTPFHSPVLRNQKFEL